jgi:uncharacterized protein (DUF2249 family)
MNTPAPLVPAPEKSGNPVFDVRVIPCRIKHGQILQRWADLAVGECFVLLNDHDPIPLRYQFEREFPGEFSWDYVERGPEDFRVRITRLAEGRKDARPPAQAARREGRDLDARGLEPPGPLVAILEALETLPAGESLRAITDREPCHLFGEVKRRGFAYCSSAQQDGSWVTVLSRA